MKKAIALIATLFFSTGALFSQQGFTFNRISTEDGIGLASNVVYCTYQDPKGFIWVGTANGLQRFDGSKFISFSFDKTPGNALQISNLTQIIPADSICLWLCFPNRQEFGIFNTSTFEYKRVAVKASKPISTKNEIKLWKSRAGEIFVTILDYGILHYDRKKKVFADDNYFHFPEGWTSTLTHFEDTVTNRFWFPCVNNGLAVYDANDGKMYTSEHNPKNIPLLNTTKIRPTTSEVFIDSKRRHWIFNWPNVHYRRCFDSTGKELSDTVGINYNPDYSEMRWFYETKQGLLWMYGTNALINYDNNQHRFAFYEHEAGSPTGIQFQYVFQIMEDHDGSLWFSTDNGLYFATPGSGTLSVVNMMFPATEKQAKPDITDVLELKSGQRWLGTWGNGIISLTKEMTRYNADIYNNMPPMDGVRWVQYRQVWALYQQADEKIWIGCQAGNYMIHDPHTRKTQYLRADVLKKATITYITGDKKGNTWFSSVRGTLARYDGKQFTVMQELGSLISKILIDKQGLIWVAAQSNGIFCLSADGKKILRHYTTATKENALFANNGSDIEELDDSTIVFGAGAMNFIDKRTGKVRWLTFEDGLPGNTIQRMRMDNDGYLWMITLNGLCRYNPVTKRVTPYDRKDGITVSHLTRGADYFCSDGTLMFTGSNAILYFHPEMFKNRRPPDVRITDFKLFDKYIPVDSLLTLPKVKLECDQNSFSIYFAALSYSQRDKLTYYYRMKGIDKDWVKIDRQNVMSYTLLPPGNYTFEVYCENIDGMRSKNISQLEIRIKPHFWQTYSFISIFLFVVALCIYMVHRLRVNKILAVEKLRTRVARDLHDDMGSTLSTINILSSMAKSKINVDPIRTTEYLGKISDNSQRMMDAMDDIVWSIKPSNDSLQKIAARMREFANNVLEAKEIELDFRVDDTVFDVKLNMEARRDFFLVFKEAVNNAAKYSKASMVTIQLGLHKGRLVLVVEDDGTGFDPETADGGNGLGNMQKRANAMQGRLQIISKPGGGTQVTLNIPVQ